VERRELLGAVTLCFLSAASLVAEAHSAARVFRIGVLGAYPPTEPASAPIFEALRQGLRELGYVEGTNLVVEGRYSDGKAERLPALAEELVRGVDVIR
jgi:putative ABC transport system substrate-binding protein